MSGTEKTLQMLLGLGNPTMRRTRAELVEYAMRVALTLTDAEAVIVRAPWSSRGKRLALYPGSVAPAVLPPPPDGSPVVRILSENCVPLLVPNLADESDFVQRDDCPGVEGGPAMFIPLRQRDPAIGYLATYRRRGRAPFGFGDSRQILLLSAWLGAALEGLRLSSGAQRLIMTDDQTDVYNARFLEAALRREVRRARRFRQELAIILIEMANLEAFISEHGDQCGNALLTGMTSLLAQQARSFDLLGRYGANVFMLILPQTDFDGAVVVAKRIRALVDQHEFAHVPSGTITVNIGVATNPFNGTDTAAVISAAQRALRQKRPDGNEGLEDLQTQIA